MAKGFRVMHTVECLNRMTHVYEYDEKIIAEFDTEEEAVKKIEELGGEKVLDSDDDWYDPLAYPVGYYWIYEV